MKNYPLWSGALPSNVTSNYYLANMSFRIIHLGNWSEDLHNTLFWKDLFSLGNRIHEKY